uniref:BTB domain-containing protein n=1 Tax=Romanomermis culicivorax TaxID=13658 RepID=A0A915IBR7_ROMCU
MSIFLSPSTERNFFFLLDKSGNDDRDNGTQKQKRQIKIWVSKEFLSIVSPVFKTMFYGRFQESELPGIYLPDKNQKDFMKFLDCLFPYSTQSDIDESNVEVILRLADEYQVEFLMKKCDQYYDKTIRSLPVGKIYLNSHQNIKQ